MCGSRAVITALEGRQREPGAEGEREGQGWRQWCEMRVEERNVRGCCVGTRQQGSQE